MWHACMHMMIGFVGENKEEVKEAMKNRVLECMHA